MTDSTMTRPVTITGAGVHLEGTVTLPAGALGLVLFAHGSGSSRLSPRNRFVAEQLHAQTVGTLLFDLLTEAESRDRSLVFDIELLASRLLLARDWLAGSRIGTDLPLGYFGASTGAAAALVAAAARPQSVAAVVSRGGRPDLAGGHLRLVRAPTLLIVGGEDRQVLELNQMALAQLVCTKKLVVIPGATHLFEEPGTLESAAAQAAGWFHTHLSAARPSLVP
jgi:pimeloyl-ACP methyl ester carboxylesterase